MLVILYRACEGLFKREIKTAKIGKELVLQWNKSGNTILFEIPNVGE